MSFHIPTEYQASLLPASYNNVFFYVTDDSVKAGQRVAEHQFPMRDSPYSEPLGRQARTYTFTGFLVGDAPLLQTQYQALLTAIETGARPGTLIHPILGSLQVICTSAEFEQTLAGRFIECRLSFIEAGEILYPSTGADGQAATINQAATAQATSQTSFGSNVGNGFPTGDNGMTPAGTQAPAAGAYDAAGNGAVQGGTTGFEGVPDLAGSGGF